MREIKYNAWDNDNKRMGRVVAIDWNDTQIISCHVDFNGKVEKLYPEYTGYGNNVIFLECVGFQDSKKNDICEGDIDQSGCVITYLANLSDGLGMEAGWYLQRDNFESWSKLECNDDIEIIGNVFETPWRAINNCNTDYVKYFEK